MRMFRVGVGLLYLAGYLWTAVNNIGVVVNNGGDAAHIIQVLFFALFWPLTGGLEPTSWGMGKP